MLRIHPRPGMRLLTLVMVSLMAMPATALARKVFNNVTISEATFRSRCEASGGKFTQDGSRVICKLGSVVVVCELLVTHSCSSNQARLSPGGKVLGLLGIRSKQGSTGKPAKSGPSKNPGTGGGSTTTSGGGGSSGSTSGGGGVRQDGPKGLSGAGEVTKAGRN